MSLWYGDDDEGREVAPKHPVAKAILEDVLDRRGIKHEFHRLDEDIAQEIMDRWDGICEEHDRRLSKELNDE